MLLSGKGYKQADLRRCKIQLEAGNDIPFYAY
jgi:hypothetical protein